MTDSVLSNLLAGRYLPIEGVKPRTGGQAIVYKCIDTRTGLIVAVKIIEGLFNDDIAAKIFKRETGALKQLTHENIVAYRTSGYDESGRMYIVQIGRAHV